MAKFEDLYEETFILNIDFLGFSNFVNKHDKKEVINIFIKSIIDISFSASILSSRVRPTKEKDITKQAYQDQLEANNYYELLIYSDTVAIKSNNPDKNMHFDDLVRLAEMIQFIIYNDLKFEHLTFLPIRGTITYGEFLFYKGNIETLSTSGNLIKAHNASIILGKAIIDAYLNEKDMEIMAIALTENCIKKILSDIHIALYFHSFLSDNKLIQYTIPCKGKDINSFLINPLIKGLSSDTAIKRLKEEAKKIDGRRKVRRKYKNTIDFLEHINMNDLYKPMPK